MTPRWRGWAEEEQLQQPKPWAFLINRRAGTTSAGNAGLAIAPAEQQLERDVPHEEFWGAGKPQGSPRGSCAAHPAEDGDTQTQTRRAQPHKERQSCFPSAG